MSADRRPADAPKADLEAERRIARLLWACLVAAGEIDPPVVPVEAVLWGDGP